MKGKWHEIVDGNIDLTKVKWTMMKLKCDYCGQEMIFGFNKHVFLKDGREFEKSNLTDDPVPFNACPNCQGEWKEEPYEGKWFGFNITSCLYIERFKSEGRFFI